VAAERYDPEADNSEVINKVSNLVKALIVGVEDLLQGNSLHLIEEPLKQV
jgi:hypothetical protein